MLLAIQHCPIHLYHIDMGTQPRQQPGLCLNGLDNGVVISLVALDGKEVVAGKVFGESDGAKAAIFGHVVVGIVVTELVVVTI